MNKNLKALGDLICFLNELDFKKGFNQENFEIEKFFNKMLKLYIERSIRESIPAGIKFSIEIDSSTVCLYHGFRRVLLEDFSNFKQEDILLEMSQKRDYLVEKTENELSAYIVQYKGFKKLVDKLFSKIKKEFYDEMEINYPLFSNKNILSDKFNLNMYDFGEGFLLELDVANHLGVKVKNAEDGLSTFSYDTTLNNIEESIRNKLKLISIELKEEARTHVAIKLKSYLVDNYPDINFDFKRKFLFVEDSILKRFDQKQYPVNILISEEDLPFVSKRIHNYFKLFENEMAKTIFSNFSIQDVNEFEFSKGIMPLNLTDESLNSTLNLLKDFENRIEKIEGCLKHEVGSNLKVYKSIYYKVLKSFEFKGKSYTLIRYRTHLSKKYKYISLEDGNPISRTKFNRKQKKCALS